MLQNVLFFVDTLVLDFCFYFGGYVTGKKGSR